MRRPQSESGVSEPTTEPYPRVGPKAAQTADTQAAASSTPACAGADTIPGYRLVGRLGGGGMGEVFLASQLFSTPDDALRTVAVKTIRAELLTSPRHRQIMENDIRIAALLDHPNIVRILEVGPADGPLYYTMPYLKGGSLADKIDRELLPARTAAEILLQIALAVDYLHSQPTPIIHLDLKPGNILLDDTGTPYVADFGLSRLVHSANGEAVTRLPGGTPEYMAPEQFDGRVSPACDIYGLGAILYKLLTGQPPFAAGSPEEGWDWSRERVLLPPATLDAAIDRGLEAICLKCLDNDPAHRYPSAGAVAEDLKRYLAGEVPQALRLCWYQSLRRHVSREIRFDAAGAWARPMLWQAVSTCPVYLGVYGLLWYESPAWYYWVWLLVLLPVAEWGPWLAPQRGRRSDPREREILLLWVCVSVAKAILFGLNCPLVGDVRPEDVLEYFPAAMAVNGLMLCLEGRLYWGRLYVVGLCDFLAAIAMACWLPAAPLLFGLWNSLVLVYIALNLRRRAAEPKHGATGSPSTTLTIRPPRDGKPTEAISEGPPRS